MRSISLLKPGRPPRALVFAAELCLADSSEVSLGRLPGLTERPKAGRKDHAVPAATVEAYYERTIRIFVVGVSLAVAGVVIDMASNFWES